MAEQIEVTYNLSTFSVYRFGEGSEYLLAFHGFNDTAQQFLVLEPSLGKKFTVLAIDFPYHGQTEWKEATPFTKNDLFALVELLSQRYGFTRYALLGFSMGAKCAMALCYLHPQKITHLLLLGADGIRTKTVYNVAVYPRWGRRLFQHIMQQPAFFFRTIHFLHRLGWLSGWLLRFTQNHMNTPEKRERLFLTWVSMADFQTPVPELKKRLQQHGVKVLLVFGLRDEVIPPSVGKYMAKDLPAANLVLLNRGHYFIDQDLNQVVDKWMAA